MFRKALAVPLSQLSINTLVQDILLHPEHFEDMYRLTADENQASYTTPLSPTLFP